MGQSLHGNVAREFIRQHEELGGRFIVEGNQWFSWEKDHYRRVPEEEVRRTFWYFISNKGTAGTRHEASEVMEAYAAISLAERETVDTARPGWVVTPAGENHDDVLLSFRNGLVGLSGLLRGEALVRPHTRDYFTQTVLPYNYDPDAQCPRWHQCINEWVPDPAAVAFLQEYVGYLLTPDYSHQIGLFLEGSGANGKSVFCEVVTRMLGRANVSGVPLDRFGDAYSLETTLGKLANIATETSKWAKVPEGILKQFISGEPMFFNQKYVRPFTTKPTARLIISWNERPRLNDGSDALWRRIRLVKFPRRYKPSEQDPALVDKLATELPGVFNWALAGLHSLRQRGRPLDVASITESVESLRADNDSVRSFVGEALVPREGASVLKSAVYDAYKTFCDDHADRALGPTAFFRRVYEILSLDPDRSIQRVGPNRARCLVGVSLAV